MDRMLLCHAKGHTGDWEAICLDLDIAVQGESFEDVFGSLNESISLYMKTVEELPEADRARLLHRRAPLSVRFKFFFYALWSLLGNNSSHDSRAQFTVACPA